MNFQKLPYIETSQQIVNSAFRSGRTEKKKIRVRGSRLEKGEKYLRQVRGRERERIERVVKVITGKLGSVVKSFPLVDELPIFYRELMRCTLDIDMLKKSLGALVWAGRSVTSLSNLYSSKIRYAQNITMMTEHRRSCYGRVASIVKQVSKNLSYLEYARKLMRQYPDVKTDIFTVAVTGFPNVGKTTLLNRITGAKAEVASYAFTTRSINMGYIKDNIHRVQVLDTPGTLNRPDRMNYMERQAHLAMEHLADMIVYVFDPTEPYPAEMQEKLYEMIMGYKKPVLVYMSKADLIGVEGVEKFKIGIKEGIFTDSDRLREKILEDAKLANWKPRGS